ncbi:unnamed protein product [Alternaria alternata]
MCTAHDPVIPFHENEVCTQYNERMKREEAEMKAREKEEERVRTQQEEDMRVRRRQEEASAAKVAKSSVKCPGCGLQIQKISGCDHMTCGRNGCGFHYEKLTLESSHCIHTNLRYCVRSGCPFGQFNEVRDADIFIYATGGDFNRVKHNVDFGVGESWKRYDLRIATSTMTPADTDTDAERAEKAFETCSEKQRSNALDAAITS